MSVSCLCRIALHSPETRLTLLCSDAGDHHDGSGLVSSSRTGAAKADEIFQMLDYDIMTIGNHELYSHDTAKVVHEQAKKLYVLLDTYSCVRELGIESEAKADAVGGIGT